MMARERITRQGEWLGLNRAAAYTLYQPRAQITLRLKTEHANAQESLWHRNEEWATISLFLSLSFSDTHTHTLTHTFHLSFFCQILSWPPSLHSSPCFWGSTILYGLSYCSSDSVMCIYCSICEIGGTGRQAYYYSITGARRFHNRGLSMSQTETLRHINFKQQTDCLTVVVQYIGGKKKFSCFPAESDLPPMGQWISRGVDLFPHRFWLLLSSSYLSYQRHPSHTPLHTSDPAPDSLWLINRLSKCLAGTQARAIWDFALSLSIFTVLSAFIRLHIPSLLAA